MKPAWVPNRVVALLLPLALAVPVVVFAKETERGIHGIVDTARIEQAIGKAGEAKGDVYKISLPRTDLLVTVNNVQVKPGFALGSRIAFKPTAQVPWPTGTLS